MRTLIRTSAAAAVACGVLLGGAGRAAAQATTTTTKPPTTTTTTSTTTTTTLLPHPFSKPTKKCVRKAKADRGRCRRSGADEATCSTQYQTAYANCFAVPAGVSCARRCVQREAQCYTALPTTKKTCRKNCRLALKNDRNACYLFPRGEDSTLWAGSDAGCLTTAQAAFELCGFVCFESSVDCTNAFKFCVANCTNL